MLSSRFFTEINTKQRSIWFMKSPELMQLIKLGFYYLKRPVCVSCLRRGENTKLRCGCKEDMSPLIYLSAFTKEFLAEILSETLNVILKNNKHNHNFFALTTMNTCILQHGIMYQIPCMAFINEEIRQI